MTTMNEERAGYMPIPTAEQVAEALANVRCFHDLSAEIIAPELLKNLLAAAPEHPARQGEAVEVAQVVSYLSACADGYDPDAPHPGPPEPLMTVAQHNRIVATLSAQHPDDAAVDRFAAAMKSKLAKSREKGRHGWQAASAAHLSSLLYRHMYKADPLDVANLAMMLHQNGQVIELPFEARMPKEQQSAPERVSVPVELLERVAYLLELGDMDGPTARELRAILEAKDE